MFVYEQSNTYVCFAHNTYRRRIAMLFEMIAKLCIKLIPRFWQIVHADIANLDCDIIGQYCGCENMKQSPHNCYFL